MARKVVFIFFLFFFVWATFSLPLVHELRLQKEQFQLQREQKQEKEEKEKHVLLIIGDDLGFNDVSCYQYLFQDQAVQFSTPNIDQLASDGILLTRYYNQPICSPSRAALLSSRYPSDIGLATGVILNGIADNSLWTNLTTMADILKENGFSSHLYGKWDLGMDTWDQTPLNRGFDSFLGYYNAQESYFEHLTRNDGLNCTEIGVEGCGYDLRINNDPLSAPDYYGPELYTQGVLKQIDNYVQQNLTSPLFLCLSQQAVHTPIEVPEEYLAGCPVGGVTQDRRLHCGLTQVLDSSVGNVTTKLKEYGLYDDFLIIFISDNGGDYTAGSSNYPLRGNKFTVFEGGTRGVGIVKGWEGSGIPKGETRNGLMHIVDWMPTICDALNVTVDPETVPMSGLSQWNMFLNEENVTRSDILLQMNPIFRGIYPINPPPSGNLTGFNQSMVNFYGQKSVLRADGMKLIVGEPQGDLRPMGWGWDYSQPSGEVYPSNETLDCQWRLNHELFRTWEKTLSNQVYLGLTDIVEKLEWKGNNIPVNDFCVWLYNVFEDPSETRNLVVEKPLDVLDLAYRLHGYEKTAVKPQLYWRQGTDPDSNPTLWNNFWTPWRFSNSSTFRDNKTNKE